MKSPYDSDRSGRSPGAHPTHPLETLARSTVSLGWSLALLGADAATRLLRGGAPEAGLDAVRHAAECEMDDTFRSIYRAGERIQSRAFDAVVQVAEGRPFDPRESQAGEPPGDCAD